MIIAVRHPRPAIAAGICYGRLDVALAEPASAGVGRLLEQISPGGAAPTATCVVTSPLRRAAEVAGPLAQALGLPLRQDERLQEMDFGHWEGVAWSEVPRGDIDAWSADVLRFRPGGGETAAELLQRVSEAWQEARAAQAQQLWLTHAGPIRCLLALSRGEPVASHFSDAIDFEAVIRLAYGDES